MMIRSIPGWIIAGGPDIGRQTCDDGWAALFVVAWVRRGVEAPLYHGFRFGWGWDKGEPVRPWPVFQVGDVEPRTTRGGLTSSRTSWGVHWLGFFATYTQDVKLVTP